MSKSMKNPITLAMVKRTSFITICLFAVTACSSMPKVPKIPNPLNREEKVGDVVVEEVKDDEKSSRGFRLNPFKRNNKKDDFEVIRYDIEQPQQERHGLGMPSLFSKEEGDAFTNENLRNKAWRKVVKLSRVQPVTTSTMRIEVNGPIVMSPSEMEYVLLARASGEALKRGYQEFAFTHLDYQGGEGLTSMLLPDVSFSERQWIGSYEDMLIARDNQNILGEMGRYGKKSITAVVVFRKTGEEKRRRTFPAEATYGNMLNSRLNLKHQ
ncbi:MAG: hypothetical protein ACWA5L_04685 [bacterium]